MGSSNFIDIVHIHCRSGKGGDGCMHLHRAKYVPKGGPDGGDGGKGGDIILRADKNVWTLLHLRYQKHIFATDGGNGGKNRSFGKAGEDRIIIVPCGTVVYNGDTGEWIGEVRDDGECLTLLRGGKGGLGNWHFKSATNQTPRYAQTGKPAQEMYFVLHLKVLADVGLVGFPNAGKSTLLSRLSAAKPEIADYPFTTLTPQLGIVSYREGLSFCMADIPGIIEGASKGKGLGLQFLRHIERNAVLLILVPITENDIVAQFNILLEELRLYNPNLLEKSRVLGISKMDLSTSDDKKKVEAVREKLKIPIVLFSSVSNDGLDQLKDVLWAELQKNKNQIIDISHAPIAVIAPNPKSDKADGDEVETIYLNEIDEEWDISKYKNIGWDTREK